VDIQSHKMSSSVVFEAEILLRIPQALENIYHFFRIRFSYCNISPWTSSPHRYCLLQTSADILQRTELNFSWCTHFDSIHKNFWICFQLIPCQAQECRKNVECSSM
jgi:hypothetical protein